MADITPLLCPSCGGRISLSGAAARCESCGMSFVVEAGAPPKLDPNAVPEWPEEFYRANISKEARRAAFLDWLGRSPCARSDIYKEARIEDEVFMYVPYFHYTVSYDVTYSCSVLRNKNVYYQEVTMRGSREVSRSGVKTKVKSEWQAHSGYIVGSFGTYSIAGDYPELFREIDAEMARNAPASDFADLNVVFDDPEQRYAFDVPYAREHGIKTPKFTSTPNRCWKENAKPAADREIERRCIEHAQGGDVRGMKWDGRVTWEARACMIPVSVIKYRYKDERLSYAIVPCGDGHEFGARPADPIAGKDPVGVINWIFVLLAVAGLVIENFLSGYHTQMYWFGRYLTLYSAIAAVVWKILQKPFRKIYHKYRLSRIAAGRQGCAVAREIDERNARDAAARAEED